MMPRIVREITRIGRRVSVLCNQIAKFDGQLCLQLRRAWVAVGMNAGEWQLRYGSEGDARFEDALRAAREARAALTMALAARYVDEPLSTRVLDDIEQVAAHLRKRANRPAPKRCMRSANRVRARRSRPSGVFTTEQWPPPSESLDEDGGTG